MERSPDGLSLLVTIALGPGGRERLIVQVPCPGQVWPDIRVGDELERNARRERLAITAIQVAENHDE